MRSRKFLLVLALALASSVLAVTLIRNGARGQEGGRAPAAAPADPETEAKVAEILKTLEAEGTDAWAAARALEALGPGAVPALLPKTQGLNVRQEAAAAFALARLGRRDEALDRAIRRFQGEKDAAARILLCDVLGAAAVMKDAERLEGLLDGVFDPAVKVALCRALWEGCRSVRAKRDVTALLESEDDEIRVQAAMTLAEMGDIEPGKRILGRIAREPTERGRLARSLLQEDRLGRALERTGGGAAGPESFGQAMLDELRALVQRSYVDVEKTRFRRLASEAIRGIMDRLDPDSAFLDEAAILRERQIESGELAGVGIFVRISPKAESGEEIRRVPLVVAPSWNGPAALAGIRPADELWEVNGQQVFGKNLVEIEGLLAGRPGTTVALTLYHRGWFRERKVTLTREKAAAPPVFSQPLPAGLWILKAGALRAGTGEEVAKEVAKAKEAGARALAFDLRDCAEGPLEAATAVAAAFLQAGAVVFTVQGRDPEALPPAESKTASAGETALPLAVLVNEGTYGAAELLAGALRDHKRASLVGVQTFGQGTVQKTIPLKTLDGKGALRLTVGRARLPVSGDFHGKGIVPDRAIAERKLEVWRQDELAKVIEAGHMGKYLEEHLEKNLDTFQALADGDGRDPSRYPGFEAWFKSTGTKVEPDDLRGVLRAEIRRRLGVRQGKPYFVDLQEDEQLQGAVATLAKAIGLDLATVPPYAHFAAKFAEGK